MAQRCLYGRSGDRGMPAEASSADVLLAANYRHGESGEAAAVERAKNRR